MKQVGVSHDSEGRVNLSFQTKLTATKLPENTKLGVHGFGMRAAHVMPTGDAPLVEVERAEENDSDAEHHDELEN